MNDNEQRVELPCTAHGWLRRPELDTETFDAWEVPGGMIFPARKGVTPHVITIWQEADPQ